MNCFRFVRARIPDGCGTVETTLTVRDGNIQAIGSSADPRAVDVDLEGKWLLPGAVDGHVHFDDPGFTHREDFASGTRAAAAGGVTTVVDMPCTSIPPVTCGSAFDEKLRVVSPKAFVDFRFWGGVRGNDFQPGRVAQDLADLRDRGVRSVKSYLISGMESFEDLDPDRLDQVFRIAKKLDLLVGVHAEDRAMVTADSEQQRRFSRNDPMAYARARSAAAESEGVRTCVRLAEATGARVHVVHLACAAGLDLVRDARSRGASVSVETCPHYLAFTHTDLVRAGSLLKTAPVVKASSDRDALWGGIVDGSIDMVATDHAPAKWPEEKRTGSIWTDYGGVPGVELMLTYLLSEGVNAKRMSLDRALQVLCEAPARIHRLPGKGRLEVGANADLVVFDPALKWTVHAEELVTRQRYTPFEGMTFTGRVERTYVRGHLVFDRVSGFTKEPIGLHVPPTSSLMGDG